VSPSPRLRYLRIVRERRTSRLTRCPQPEIPIPNPQTQNPKSKTQNPKPNTQTFHPNFGPSPARPLRKGTYAVHLPFDPSQTDSQDQNLVLSPESGPVPRIWSCLPGKTTSNLEDVVFSLDNPAHITESKPEPSTYNLVETRSAATPATGYLTRDLSSALSSSSLLSLQILEGP